MTEDELKIIELYRNMKLKKIEWLEFAKPITEYIDKSDLNLLEISEKLNISVNSLHTYSKSYRFLLVNTPILLNDSAFVKLAQATRLDDLRRLLDKQPEYFDDKDLTEFTRRLMMVDTVTSKKMLLKHVDEESIRISDRDILHTELMIRIVHDKLKDILRDPRAQAELRIKLGHILHDCAINLESVADPKFAASVEEGRLETIDI